MSLREKLIADIESYCATTGYKPSYVCRRVMGSGSWWNRLLDENYGLQVSTIDKFSIFFDEQPAVRGANPRGKPKRRRRKAAK